MVALHFRSSCHHLVQRCAIEALHFITNDYRLLMAIQGPEALRPRLLAH
jgi:hypothetical protein